MHHNKKTKYRRRRALGRLLVIPEYDLVKPVDRKTVDHKRLANFDDDGFEKHMDELFHWHVSQQVISILVAQLDVITTEFIDEVIKRLKSCNNTAFTVNEDLLSKEKNKYFVEIHRNIQALVSDPNLLYPIEQPVAYKHAVLQKVQGSLSAKDKTAIKCLAFECLEHISQLYKLRYGKRTGERKNKAFVEKCILASVDLSNFIRGGSVKSVLTYEKYKARRLDFLKKNRTMRKTTKSATPK